jgi:hypothetical protein
MLIAAGVKPFSSGAEPSTDLLRRIQNSTLLESVSLLRLDARFHPQNLLTGRMTGNPSLIGRRKVVDEVS